LQIAQSYFKINIASIVYHCG